MFFDDLDQIIANGPAKQAPADMAHIRELHIEVCQKCHGTGRFVAYTGRPLGKCFACEGRGKKSFKTAPAVRQAAAEQRASQPQRRWDAFVAQHPAEAAWIISTTFGFATSMKEAVERYGSLTEKQMATVHRLTAADAERTAQRIQAAVQRAEQAPGIDVAKIAAALQRASQAGLSAPKLRLGDFVFSPAPASGKNAGSIYVKHRTMTNDEGQKAYLGKITDGRFLAAYACTAEMQGHLIELAADPAASAVQYGRQIGACACCGRTLVDPESVARGIGPICAGKFGF